jgi:hypothetical protein
MSQSIFDTFYIGSPIAQVKETRASLRQKSVALNLKAHTTNPAPGIARLSALPGPIDRGYTP